MLLFFFLAKKKRREILAQQRSKRQRIMSTACTSNRQKACVANTGKGNHGRLQAPGGQREKRAIPPDGFTVFSPGQCCRICQSIIGRTMFAPTVFLFKSHRSMWASTPTVITQLQLHGKYRQGQLWRLQAPGGQREQRAIPPDGFTVFSPGQCCRERQSIIGRTMKKRTSRP